MKFNFKILSLQVLQADNIYTTDTSVFKSKCRTTSINLYDAGQDKIKVTNLPEPMAIRSYPQQMDNVVFTSIDLQNYDATNLFYIELRLNETEVVPVLMLRQTNVTGCLVYYVTVGSSPPTSNDYDLRGELCQEDLTEISNDIGTYVVQFDEKAISDKLNNTSSSYVYVGLHQLSKYCPCTVVITEFC